MGKLATNSSVRATSGRIPVQPLYPRLKIKPSKDPEEKGALHTECRMREKPQNSHQKQCKPENNDIVVLKKNRGKKPFSVGK